MNSPLRQVNTRWISGALGAMALSLLLAWLSNRGQGLADWPAFLLVLLLCGAVFALAWRSIREGQPPRWLLLLTLGAILLRLALGAFWHLALPEWGYDTPVQAAGYVMEDAFNRDAAAWRLAQSETPLSEAFRGYSVRDQYGGLLYVSAAVYRYSGANQHQALLVLMLSATLSGLAVAYTWALARGLWGERTARLAAWGLALFPEAVLLGSSQMREAFSVALTMAALYGLWRMRGAFSWRNSLLIVLPILLAIPLSWPFAASLLGLLALAALPLFGWQWLKRPLVWAPVALLALAGAAWLFSSGASGDLWIVQSAEWQAYISQHASGWVARQFERMPLWGQIPFLLIYGVFRPLLPAAIFADGLPLWRAIAIWRALGWTLVLALLFFASYMALRRRALFKLPGMLLLSNWAFILIASYRGGGDLWDSPRYRSAFAGIQLALASWAWVQQRESEDPWLRRALVGAGLMVAWFAPWYLRRYADFNWPLVELYQVVGLGLASAALYAIWDWLSA